MKYAKSTEITSHEIACEVLEKDPNANASASDKLDDIRMAIQKVTNHDPKKKGTRWRPWFNTNYDTGAFGFSDSGYDGWFSVTLAGARLCWNFATEEDSDHFGSHFESLHREVWES